MEDGDMRDVAGEKGGSPGPGGVEGAKPRHAGRIVCAIAIACSVALAVAAISWSAARTASMQEQIQQAQQPAAAQAGAATVMVRIEAPGFDAATSTPAVLVASDGQTTTATAVPVGSETGVDLAGGSWTLSVLSPIDADGSIYELPSAVDVEVAASDSGMQASSPDVDLASGPVAFSLTPIAAGSQSEQQERDALSDLVSALASADPSLSASASSIAQLAADNAAASGKVTAEEARAIVAPASGEDASGAEGAAEQAASTGDGAAENDSTTGGPASGGAAGAHEHKWSTFYKTVEVPATWRTVHHDSVWDDEWKCSACGQTFDTAAKASSHLASSHAGDHSATTSKVRVLVTPAHDERVLVSSEHTAQVPDGQVCTSCGLRR